MEMHTPKIKYSRERLFFLCNGASKAWNCSFAAIIRTGFLHYKLSEVIECRQLPKNKLKFCRWSEFQVELIKLFIFSDKNYQKIILIVPQSAKRQANDTSVFFFNNGDNFYFQKLENKPEVCTRVI